MRLGWKREWTIIAGIYIALHILYIFLMGAVLKAGEPEPMARGYGYEAIYPLLDKVGVFNQYANLTFRWDTVWYLKIAMLGYDPQGTTTFMPLFPLAIRLFSFVTGGNSLFAALLISNIAGFIALVLFYELSLIEGFSSKQGVNAVISWITFPTAVFLFLAYTESLFLCFVLAAFIFARKKKWMWSALFGALAALTRGQGIILAPVLAGVWIESLVAEPGDGAKEVARKAFRLISSREGWNQLRAGIHFPILMAIVAPIAGYVAYLAWLALNGLPGPAAALNILWGIKTVLPWDGLALLARRLVTYPYVYIDFVDLSLFVLVLGLFVAGLGRLSPSLSLYSALTLVILMMRGDTPQIISSYARYFLAIFPVFMVIGQSRHSLLRLLYWAFGLLVGLVFAWAFFSWKWIG